MLHTVHYAFLQLSAEEIIFFPFCAFFQPGSQMLQSDLGGDNLSLSQDSLDDNIGVDQVMCHRLLGEGKLALAAYTINVEETPLSSEIVIVSVFILLQTSEFQK